MGIVTRKRPQLLGVGGSRLAFTLSVQKAKAGTRQFKVSLVYKVSSSNSQACTETLPGRTKHSNNKDHTVTEAYSYECIQPFSST